MKYRATRYPTRFPITLEAGTDSQNCMVTSISTSGACVVNEDDLTLGARVVLKYPAGQVRAVVKWMVGGTVGLAFEIPLASAVVDRIRHGVRASMPHLMQRPTHFRELR